MISSVANRREYQGDGSSAVFAFPYLFQRTSDLGVFIYNSSVVVGGIFQPQYLGVDYTISATANDQGIYPNGGNVVFNSTPNPQGVVIIFRSSVLTNNFNVGQNGAIPSKSLNNEIDYLTILLQRQQEQGTRSVRVHDSFFGVFDPTLPANLKVSAGKRLIVNSSATGWTFDETIGSYIPNTVIYATTNSSISSVPGAATGLYLQSFGSSPPAWAALSISVVSGVLPNTNGGTGTGSSFTRGLLVFAGSSGIYDRTTGMSWDENGILQIGSTFANVQIFSVGTFRAGGLVAGPVRTSATGVMSVGSTNLTSEVAGVLPVPSGGTNLNTMAPQWGVLFASTASSVGVVPAGGPGTVLTSNGSSAPSYQPITVTQTVLTKTADYVTTNADAKIVAASSLFTVYLYKPVAGDAGREIEVFKSTNTTDFNRVVISGSNCTINRNIGVVNSTAVHTHAEWVKFFTDGTSWYESDRHTQNSWYSYTPVFGAGWGSTSAVVYEWHRREDMISVMGSHTNGGTTGNICSVTLPPGINVSKVKLAYNSSISTTGVAIGRCLGTAGASDDVSVVIVPNSSVNTVYFGQGPSAAVKLGPANGTNFTGNAANMSMRFEFPVDEWNS